MRLNTQSKGYKDAFANFSAIKVEGENGTLAKLHYYQNFKYSKDGKEIDDLLHTKKYQPLSDEDVTKFGDPWNFPDGKKMRLIVGLLVGIGITTTVCLVFFILDMLEYRSIAKGKAERLARQEQIERADKISREQAKKYLMI